MALFRRLYRVPDDVGLRYVHWSDALPPSSGELLIPVVAVVEGGVRFPIDPLLADFLSYFSLSPTQVNPNIFRIVMGTVELNRRLGLELSTYDIVWTYILHRNSKTESYSLRPRDINYTLVNGLPDTNRGFDDDYLVVTGEWFLPGRRCPTKDGEEKTSQKLRLRSTAYAKSGSASTARTIGHNPAPPQSFFVIRHGLILTWTAEDVIDGTAPDMAGINLRNLLPTRRDEGTSVGAPSSSRPASRKRGRTEGTAGPSRPTVDPLPSSSVPEPPSTDQQVTQLGNVIRPGMLLRSGSQVRGDSGSVASALSQAVRLPLDMGEWKKTPDEELINNMRRGALMGVQASLELEEWFPDYQGTPRACQRPGAKGIRTPGTRQLKPKVPFPGARPPPPPEVVLGHSPRGAVPEDAVPEDAVPEDAAQAPSVGEEGDAVPDEAGPDV
uniref:Uncharacterized protein n=1 Tax=Fagus sylvatica TaxID=28930 RepID=A0A2N9F8L1_FAGSY